MRGVSLEANRTNETNETNGWGMRCLGRTKARPYSDGGGAGLEPIRGDDEWSKEGELGVEELEGETVVGCGAVGGDSCTL